MENVNRYIENLLSYGEKELYLTPEGKVYARNRLLELLQTEPSYDAVATNDLDLETILEDLTDYAVENGIVDEEMAVKFPDKLMNIILPSQDDVARTYSRIHRDRGREEAEKYFLRISQCGGFVKRLAPGSIGWFIKSRNGEFAILVPSEEKVSEEEGYYPKCAYCVENIGFCGMPGEGAYYTKRVIPMEIEGEKWYFSYREKQHFKEEFVVSSEKHRPSGESRSVAAMADIAEKVPSSFVTTTYEKQVHEHYWGGKRVMNIFGRPDKKVLYDGDFKVSVLDWCFSTLRFKCYIKSDLVKAVSKVLKYWRNYAEGNIVYPIIYCTEEGYFADVVCLKTGKATPLFEKPDPFAAAGMFILPSATKYEVIDLVKELGEKKVDFEKLNDSPELGKYLEWIIQIAAAKGTEMSPEKARRALIAIIGETCLAAADDFSIDDKELEKIYAEALK